MRERDGKVEENMFKRNPLVIVHLSSDTGIPPIPVFEKKFIVGRKPTHLVSIPDNSISRDHVEVIFQDGQLYVMDMGTSNGTKVDGQRIPSNIPTPYHQGKIVSLGSSKAHFTIEIFEEDREKRKNNPSLKAIQQFNASQYPQVQNQPQIQNHPTPTQQPHPQPHLQPQAQSQSHLTSVSMSSQPMTSNLSSTSAQHETTAAATPMMMAPHSHEPHNEPSISLQTREDANRILAKAKIDAEIASKGLLRSKEEEAQKLIHQAQNKVSEILKEAEAKSQNLIQQALQEAQKIKDEKLDEGKQEKEKILSQVLTEKNLILKDIDALKQTIPNLSSQIDQLKIQTQRFYSEKTAAETQFTQEVLKLEKLQSEIKNYELQIKTVQQQLDANQRKVNEAEEKYNQTKLANQTLIQETKLALENAKARESELQTLIENAKRENSTAIKQANEVKADAEAYSKVMREEADAYAKSVRENSDAWEKQIRETTEQEIKAKYEKFNIESERLTLERDRLYQETKAKQESLLEELRATENLKLKNIQDIDSILKQKTDDYEASFSQRKSTLENEFQTRQMALDSELKKQREAIERELSDRRTSIERELLERREILERESAETRLKIENEAQELRALRDKEYKEMKMQQDAYLFDLKKREEERLKIMVEESRKMIREQYAEKKQAVQNALTDFFTDYSTMAPSSMREHLPDLHKQLNSVLKDALLSEKNGEDKQLKQLFEYDPNIQKKHKRFWIRFAVAATLIVLGISYLLYNPKSISKGADSLTEMVNEIDLQNKKVHTDMMEKIKQSAIYKPNKDDSFKPTYTENILYTNHYLDFENNDQYRNQWIVEIKEYLIQKAKLIDDRADEILSKEGALIAALSAEKIDGRNPEMGINKMNEIESEFNQLLAKHLNQDFINHLKEKKKNFFEKFSTDLKNNRIPATSK